MTGAIEPQVTRRAGWDVTRIRTGRDRPIRARSTSPSASHRPFRAIALDPSPATPIAPASKIARLITAPIAQTANAMRGQSTPAAAVDGAGNGTAASNEMSVSTDGPDAALSADQ